MSRFIWLMVLALTSTATGLMTVAKAAEGLEFEPSTTHFQLPDGVTLGAVSGVGVDDAGNVYLLQRQAPPVMCFDRSGKFVRSFGDNLVGTGHGLAVDPEGNVWVTDTGHHLVFKFSPEGKLLLALGQSDKPGTGENQFDKPTHTAFGSNGDVFVTDGYGNSRIVRLNSDGKFIQEWGKAGAGPGEFKSPHAAIVDNMGRLLVCDRDNQRIQIFSQDGMLLETWSGYTPFGIAIDGHGMVFTADGKLNQISQLDSKGMIVRSWGKEGVEPGQFKTPHLITADKSGNLYVAEVGGRRLQMLKRRQ
ncbi:MAG: peptidyl-alpha-hydroxyglycine alpha-amidating lyase family protein [Planctomyces sp.]|jgi:streptogramin lyase